MQKKICSFIAFIVFILVATISNAQWPATSMYTKPWTRWWVMGSALDQQNVKHQLTQFRNAGMGGVELVPIYGVKNADDKYLSYLSKPWMKMLDYTTMQADSLKMGVYMSMGSGWPIGGPQVSMNDAASKLVIEKFSISADENTQQKFKQKERSKQLQNWFL